MDRVSDALPRVSIFTREHIGVLAQPAADRLSIEEERVVPVRIQVDLFRMRPVPVIAQCFR